MGLIVLIGLGAFLLGGLRVEAATHRVPEDYPTVLAGLDAAVAGDSVLVGPGTWTARDTRTLSYAGGLRSLRANGFLKPGVTLIGTAGSEVTILEGALEEPPVRHAVLWLAGDSSGPPVRVQGLTIRGSGFPYFGIRASSYAPLTVEDCTIEDSMSGMEILGSDLEMRSTVVRGHEVPEGTFVAAGIRSSESNWLLVDCTFEGNIGPQVIENDTGGETRTTIRRCQFLGNERRVIELAYQDPLIIEDCWFEGNVGGAFGSGRCISLNHCDGWVRRNTFLRNGADAPGSSLVTTSVSTLEIEQNTFFGDEVPGVAFIAGVALDTNVSVVLQNNVFAGFRGGPALGIHSSGQIQPDGGCNIFWDNDDPQFYRYTPKPTDLEADPLFCDPDAGDLTVAENSPCLAAGIPGCELIGAWDLGCGVISIEATSWARIKSLYRGEE